MHLWKTRLDRRKRKVEGGWMERKQERMEDWEVTYLTGDDLVQEERKPEQETR